MLHSECLCIVVYRLSQLCLIYHWFHAGMFLKFINLFSSEANYFTILWWFFAINWHESAIGVHVSPILNPPPISFLIPSLWVVPVYQLWVPCFMHWTWTGHLFHYDNIHVSMLFSQIIPPSPFLTESKSLFFITVSLLLSCIQSCHYHLSKCHIYALIYCISVFLSDLIHTV